MPEGQPSGVKHVRGFDVVKPFSVGMMVAGDAAAHPAAAAVDLYLWHVEWDSAISGELSPHPRPSSR